MSSQSGSESSDLSDFDLSKSRKPQLKRKSRVISSDSEEDVPISSAGPSQSSTTMEPEPDQPVVDNFMTKAEGDFHKKIQGQLRVIKKAQKIIDKWLPEYEEMFGRSFDENRVVPIIPSVSTFAPTYTHFAKQQQPPDYINGCRVCGRRGTPVRYGSCQACLTSGSAHSSEQLKCDGLWQQPGNCPVDYRFLCCVACRCFKLKQVAPNYYTANNFLTTKRLEITEPGQYGFVMDLSPEKVNALWFDKRRLDTTATTAVLIIRAMNLNAKGKDDQPIRELLNVLVRFDLFDPKWESSCGLVTLMNAFGVTKLFLGKSEKNNSTLAMLLEVFPEMIPWSDWDSKKWTRTGAVEITSFDAADFLLTPLLNKIQSVQTRFASLVLESEYLDLDRLDLYLKRRGGSLEWIRTDEKGQPFSHPIEDNFKGGLLRKREKKHQFQQQQDVKKRTNVNSEPTKPQPTSFDGCIYVYIFSCGHIYVGKNQLLLPRIHQQCDCSMCQFVSKSEKKYIKTVIYYVEKTEELKVYEGIIQFLLKMAELKRMTPKDLNLTFPLKKEDYEQSWKEFDPETPLPDEFIKLLNIDINTKSLSTRQFDAMINIYKVFLKTDLKIEYDYLNDPLNYTKNF